MSFNEFSPRIFAITLFRTDKFGAGVPILLIVNVSKLIKLTETSGTKAFFLQKIVTYESV